MQFRHRSRRGLTTVAVGILMVVVGATEAQAAGGKLLGKQYLSISAVRDGKPHKLVDGTRVRVGFAQRANRRAVAWRAGCNRFGAPATIRPRRLRTGRITGTEVGCRKALHRQDRWLARFFSRDPRWVGRGKRLRLRSGNDVIRLRRHASGRPPEPSVDPPRVPPRCDLVEGDCSIYSDRYWKLREKYERFEFEPGVYPYHPSCMEAVESGEPVGCPAAIVFLYPDGTLGSSHWVIDPCAPGGWRLEGSDPPSC